jgi:hypothetical protein
VHKLLLLLLLLLLLGLRGHTYAVGALHTLPTVSCV